MLTQTLQTIFVRDLNKLKKELESYPNEADIWKIEKLIANSAGNLCLHLVGNLNTYIGTVLGNTGYVRNRDLEFSLKDIPQKELIEKVVATIQVIEKVLPTISEEKLKEEYPLLVLAEKTSVEFFLVHLAAHLSYHLGQVNYHRRLVAAK
jgi:uncharacterized damage-inducible protein DinB